VGVDTEHRRDLRPGPSASELPRQGVVGQAHLEDLVEAELEVGVLDRDEASTLRSRLRCIRSADPMR
jgi:hypothetical protein